MGLAPLSGFLEGDGVTLEGKQTSLTFCTKQFLSGKVPVLGSLQPSASAPFLSSRLGQNGGRPHPLVAGEAGCGAE